jgi:hypothetical protein
MLVWRASNGNRVRPLELEIQAEVDNFYFSGANLRDMLYRNEYKFDTLFFFNPRIKFYSRKNNADLSNSSNQELNEILKVFDLKLLGFDQANLDFYVNDTLAGIIHEFSFGLVNTKFDPDSLLNDRILARYDDFYINFDSLDFFLPGIEHELRLTGFDMSLKDSAASLQSIRLKPAHTNTESVYDVRIPGATADGIYAHQESFNRNLDFRSMVFNNPEITIKLPPKSDRKTKQGSGIGLLKDNSALRANWWDSLHIQMLQFSNINLNVAINDTTEIHIPDLDFGITNLEANKGETMKADRFMYAEDLSINAGGVDYNAGSTHLTTKTLAVSTGEKSIDLDSIMVSAQGESPATIYVRNLAVQGFEAYELLSEGSLIIDDIAINDPEIEMTRKEKSEIPETEEEAATRFAQLDEYPLAGSPVKSVDIGHLEVNNAILQMNGADTTQIGTLGFSVNGFRLDSALSDLEDRPFHADSYSFFADSLDYRLSPFMTANLRSAAFTSADSVFQIKGANIIPSYSKREFGLAFGKQTDWLELKTNTIRVEGLDLASIILNKDIHARNIKLDTVFLSLFRDKNVPFPEDQIRYLPQKRLDDLAYNLYVDSVLARNLNVTYEELPENGDIAGKITFDHIDAKIFPVTNVPEMVPADSMMKVYASGLLMKSGNLSADFKFNLLDPAYSWNVRASLGPMDLTRLNPMLVNAASARIKRGSASRLNEVIFADDTYAEGQMEFVYKNLAVELLNPDRVYEKKGLGKAIITFFANAFVVKARNPRPFLKKGEIFFIRDHQRSIWNYLSKATLSGVVTSIGARSNQRMIREHNREEKRLAQDTRKQNKQRKKEDRRRSRETD